MCKVDIIPAIILTLFHANWQGANLYPLTTAFSILALLTTAFSILALHGTFALLSSPSLHSSLYTNVFYIIFIYLVVAGRFLPRLSLELSTSTQQSTITVYPLFDMQACPRELPPAP
jgi:hypothetical protein